ncbi:MAG TPA: DoxX family protein [Ignavibacteriaceae bacterium]|nr:DoxX family protein [Ignavibacteriaceae bacterium]
METVNKNQFIVEERLDTNNKIVGYLYNTNQRSLSISLLLLRCTIGIILFIVGSGKVFGWFGGFGMDLTLKFYNQSGISNLFAYMSIYTEFIGGLLLALGFLTRFVSIAIIINMIVATIISLPNGFLGPNGASYPFVFLIIAITIFLAGPMSLSIDNIIKKKSFA